jgi:hypothetical protein
MASWREKLLFPRGAGEIRSYHTEWEVPEFECLTSQWCTNVNHTSNWWQLTRPLQMDNVLRCFTMFYWGNSKFSVALLLEYNLFLGCWETDGSPHSCRGFARSGSPIGMRTMREGYQPLHYGGRWVTALSF